jgi:peptidase M28-like protein
MTGLLKRFFCSMIRILVLLVIAFVVIWWFVARPASFYTDDHEEDIMVDALTLKQHVQILSQDFAPRDYHHLENLDRAGEYIRRHFQATGARVYYQPYDVDGVIYKNVIAEFGPECDAIIIVGAHYDAVLGVPGADDNASGIAGLLEMARLLADTSLNTRVVLAAYTLEEPPFFTTEYMGSDVHAKSLKARGVHVELMICFEMIGYFTQKPGSQEFPSPLLKLYYPTTGNFIAIVDQMFSTNAGKLKRWMRKKTDLPVHSINAPKWLPGVDWSDHRSYWKYGYPAVMITDTAFYRNKAYHTMDDTEDRLDYDHMAKVVYGVYSYVRQLANK